MLRFAFNKLVRDNILAEQLAGGSKPKYRMLNKKEHLEQLLKKLTEEAAEVTAAKPEKVASEIADLQQVVDDIVALLDVDPKEVQREQARKNQKVGSFKQGIYIEHVDVGEDDPWITHYRKNPERYPEIK